MRRLSDVDCPESLFASIDAKKLQYSGIYRSNIMADVNSC